MAEQILLYAKTTLLTKLQERGLPGEDIPLINPRVLHFEINRVRPTESSSPNELDGKLFYLDSRHPDYLHLHGAISSNLTLDQAKPIIDEYMDKIADTAKMELPPRVSSIRVLGNVVTSWEERTLGFKLYYM